MGKPASHGLLWKRTNVNDAIPEQPTAKAVEQRTPIKKTIVKKKEDLTRRKALMDAMSKLSLRSPLKNLKGSTPKKLLIETRTPSPNLPAASKRYASVRLRSPSPFERFKRENGGLYVVKDCEFNI
uniref:Uncharacterized protein n=1 Tax=Panagrolaimus sp. ES5 TaxID=591445 RepID=A0AC34GIK1_9BILA